MAKPTQSTTHTIAIVGAGFSGTIIAARLLQSRLHTPGALKILLINRPSYGVSGQAGSDNLARGLAYGTKSDTHLLNVPAGRMSAFPENENDFLDFLKSRRVEASGGTFVSRRWYGEYLRHTLDVAIANPAHGNRLEIASGEVVSLAANGHGIALTFSDGREWVVDRVVLALGNFAPANPALKDSSGFTSPNYIRDPWLPGALDDIDATQPIVLIGTGLTMFDVVLTLSAKFTQAKFIALSRRGLLPQSHRESTKPPQFDHAPERILQGPATALTYLRAVRATIADYAKAGGDWRDVIASLRPLTPALWQRLPTPERARLLRHARPYWESHRHRAAPDIARAVASLITHHRLQIKAARLSGMSAINGDSPLGLQLYFQCRQSAHHETLSAGTVINCTGPTSDYQIAKEALLLNLAAQGKLQADANRLGIAVNNRLEVLDIHGQPVPHLYCVGPLLKAHFWEATAVPELREHARAVVDVLLASLSS